MRLLQDITVADEKITFLEQLVKVLVLERRSQAFALRTEIQADAPERTALMTMLMDQMEDQKVKARAVAVKECKENLVRSIS